MFFQEFFVVFENDVSQQPVAQTATVYVNTNSVYNAYVGNEVLP